jgi:hypothetical protein
MVTLPEEWFIVVNEKVNPPSAKVDDEDQKSTGIGDVELLCNPTPIPSFSLMPTQIKIFENESNPTILSVSPIWMLLPLDWHLNAGESILGKQSAWTDPNHSVVL